MRTVRCSGRHGGGSVCWRGVVSAWKEGVCLGRFCLRRMYIPCRTQRQTSPSPPDPEADTPSPVDRILDTRLWKHYLSATTVANSKNGLEGSRSLVLYLRVMRECFYIVLGENSFWFRFRFTIQFLPLWSIDDKAEAEPKTAPAKYYL